MFIFMIDLRSVCYQLNVRDTDIAKTAFKAKKIHFDFFVKLFGLTNAPVNLFDLMNMLFK